MTWHARVRVCAVQSTNILLKAWAFDLSVLERERARAREQLGHGPCWRGEEPDEVSGVFRERDVLSPKRVALAVAAGRPLRLLLGIERLFASRSAVLLTFSLFGR
eukprot:6048209-Pleurochrysis_carterae.AAC.1